MKLKDLKEECKAFDLKMLRNAAKDTHILALASSLLERGNCTLKDGTSIERVILEDVVVTRK